MVTRERLHTADDLWRLTGAAGDGPRYELDEGVLIEMSPTGDKHGELALWVGHLILSYVLESAPAKHARAHAYLPPESTYAKS